MHADTHRGQKKGLDPLELEYWAVVSHLTSGNQTLVLCRAASTLHCFAVSSPSFLWHC